MNPEAGDGGAGGKADDFGKGTGLRPIRIDDHQALRTSATDDLERAAVDYLAQRGSEHSLRAADEFVVTSSRTGMDGLRHVRMQQYHDGIPVLGGDVIVHADSRSVLSANGVVAVGLPDESNSLRAISQRDAVANALRQFATDNGSRVGAFRTSRDQAQLVYFTKDATNPKLAWHVQFFTEKQGNIGPGLWSYFVDANTGKVTFSYNGIHAVVAQGSGPGGNEKVSRTWTDALDVTDNSGNFVMNTDRLETVDMKNATEGNGTAVAANTLAGFNDPAANDAHGFAEITLSMYQEWFGLNSIDNAGFKIRSRVHYDKDYVNAFWDGQQMTYGDGGDIDTGNGESLHFYQMSGDIVVVAHEISHGYTTNNGNMFYFWEPGGMNESFSDIAGLAADYFIGDFDGKWEVGADIFEGDGALRYMCDPTKDGQSIDHHDNMSFLLDVHLSSGIGNKAFCLAAKRLSNDGDAAGEASPKGVERAAEAWFNANQNYWQIFTTFNLGCQGIVSAAEGLEFSAEEIDMIKASWADVGISCEGFI